MFAIKKNLANLVKYSRCSERFALIVIQDFLFVSVYFPTAKSDAELCIVQSMLADIEEAFSSFPSLQIVCGGDFNVNLEKVSGYSNVFVKFMRDYGLISTHEVIPSNMNYTYCHESLQHFSYIDYFLIANALKDRLLDFKILDLAYNFSDHNPLFVEIACKLTLGASRPVILQREESPRGQKRLRWDKAELYKYYDLSRSLLQPLHYQCLNFDTAWTTFGQGVASNA